MTEKVAKVDEARQAEERSREAELVSAADAGTAAYYRAAERRSDFASERARERAPQGVAEVIIERMNSAKKTSSEPTR